MSVAFYRIYPVERHIDSLPGPMPGPPLPPCAAGRVSYLERVFQR